MNNPEKDNLAGRNATWEQDFNYQDHDWLEQADRLPSPDILGAISRADERQMKQVLYYNLAATLAVGTPVIFDPGYNVKPDFWVVYVAVSAAGAGIAFQEEGQDLLTFVLNPSLGAVFASRTFRIPGKAPRLTISAVAVNVNVGQVVAAACWGYDPKDILTS